MVMGAQPLVSVVALNSNWLCGHSILVWGYLPTDYLGEHSTTEGG